MKKVNTYCLGPGQYTCQFVIAYLAIILAITPMLSFSPWFKDIADNWGMLEISLEGEIEKNDSSETEENNNSAKEFTVLRSPYNRLGNVSGVRKYDEYFVSFTAFHQDPLTPPPEHCPV